jgi:hypothetical protein
MLGFMLVTLSGLLLKIDDWFWRVTYALPAVFAFA